MSEPSIVSQNTLSRKPLQIYINPSLLGISLQEAQESPNPRNKHQRQGGVHRSRMDVRMLGFETPVMSALQHLLDHVHGDEASAAAGDKAGGSAATATPARAYVRDARAMATTQADVKELPGAYAFVLDMPGLGAGDVRVQVEDDRVLAISGERRRPDEEAAAGSKYLRMERRMGKLMRRFALPEDADAGKVSAACRDGVLTVTVEKLPPPEPKKPRTIQVSIA